MTGIELRDLLVEWGVSGGTMAGALSQLGYSAEPATIRAWRVVPPAVVRIVETWRDSPSQRPMPRPKRSVRAMAPSR